MLLFSTEALSPNQLLYEVARHNFSTYVVKDFDLEVMNFGPLGLLIIKGFDNQAELNHYRSLLARDGTFTMPAEVRPVEISKNNFEQLLKGAGSFDDYFRFIGEETIRDIHESVLPPDEYPPAEEMYPPAPEDTDSQEVKPETKTEPKPATKTETKKETKKADKTTVKEPDKKSTPVTTLPDYPLGSEGDEDD